MRASSFERSSDLRPLTNKSRLRHLSITAPKRSSTSNSLINPSRSLSHLTANSLILLSRNFGYRNNARNINKFELRIAEYGC